MSLAGANERETRRKHPRPVADSSTPFELAPSKFRSAREICSPLACVARYALAPSSFFLVTSTRIISKGWIKTAFRHYFQVLPVDFHRLVAIIYSFFNAVEKLPATAIATIYQALQFFH